MLGSLERCRSPSRSPRGCVASGERLERHGRYPVVPDDRRSPAMKPSRWMLFLRTFPPHPLYRFAWVNPRMLVMMWKSHG